MDISLNPKKMISTYSTCCVLGKPPKDPSRLKAVMHHSINLAVIMYYTLQLRTCEAASPGLILSS